MDALVARAGGAMAAGGEAELRYDHVADGVQTWAPGSRLLSGALLYGTSRALQGRRADTGRRQGLQGSGGSGTAADHGAGASAGLPWGGADVKGGGGGYGTARHGSDTPSCAALAGL